MFGFGDLSVPLVAAPMAGGPSTPELVVAAATVGGLGFLAAGYKRPDAVAAEIAAVRSATGEAFGVNLFVPSDDPIGRRVLDYRAALQGLADRFGVELPDPRPDDDSWDDKVSFLLDDPVPVVSFTFGLPPASVVKAMQARGTCVVASVASVADGALAAALGVDAIVVQGVEAGGHRATLTSSEQPNPLSAVAMLPRLADLGVPLIAAGGIASAWEVRTVLDAGAAAAQVGTALLLCPEAGTSTAHRAALVAERFTDTVVTRCFTGRPARALANAFTHAHPDAPAGYPAVHQLTGPIRAAAARAGDLEHVHAWAGTGWRQASTQPAADVLRSLAG